MPSRPVLRDVVLGGLFVAGYNLAWVGLIAAISGRAGLTAFFSFPSGSVWSNLLASALLGAIVVWRMIKQHHERMTQAQQHHIQDMAHREKLHQEMLEHVRKHGRAEPWVATAEVPVTATPSSGSGIAPTARRSTPRKPKPESPGNEAAATARS